MAQLVLDGSIMKTRHASFVLTFTSILLAACGSTVTGGGLNGRDCSEDCEETTTSGADPDPRPGAGGAGSQDTTTNGADPDPRPGAGGAGAAGPQVSDAVAMTRAQTDVLWQEYWEMNDPSGSTVSSGGGGLDPNDLFIELSNLGASCGSPFVELPCGGNWSVTIVVPPAIQQIGIYELNGPELLAYSSMSETGAPNSPTPGDCSWGGGSLGAGTLEILSINPTEVQFQLVVDSFGQANPSGLYTALRCP